MNRQWDETKFGSRPGHLVFTSRGSPPVKAGVRNDRITERARACLCERGEEKKLRKTCPGGR